MKISQTNRRSKASYKLATRMRIKLFAITLIAFFIMVISVKASKSDLKVIKSKYSKSEISSLNAKSKTAIFNPFF